MVLELYLWPNWLIPWPSSGDGDGLPSDLWAGLASPEQMNRGQLCTEMELGLSHQEGACTG